MQEVTGTADEYIRDKVQTMSVEVCTLSTSFAACNYTGNLESHGSAGAIGTGP